MFWHVLKLKCSLESFSFVPKGSSRGGGHERQPCHHHEIGAVVLRSTATTVKSRGESRIRYTVMDLGQNRAGKGKRQDKES